ncbi:MAG: signal peptide peptidase SppA [Roseiflexaceae bacterium]
MVGRLALFWANTRIRSANLWRRIRKRRVDYVRLTLSGSIAELSDNPPRWQRMLLGARPQPSAHSLRWVVRRIAHDPHVKGIYLRISNLQSGWATLQSLREALLDLRAQGKQVVVYLLDSSITSVYLASAATMIFMAPTEFWNVVGIRAEVQFFRDALAKWGIEVEATAVSPYKSAPDTLVRNDFSPESRAQFERMLDLRYAELIQALASGRSLDPASVEALIDQAPLAPQAALAAKLVDRLLYEDEVEAALREGDREPIILELGPALRALQQPLEHYQQQVVALVRVEGTIASGRNRQPPPLPLPLFGKSMAGAESFAQLMRQIERNKRIAAVVVYVNSPGGEVGASDLMWRELQRVRQRKPVVVAMGNAAASGGYYLATHASAIVARPATLTGSIGVFIMRPVVAGLLERAEISTTVISRGANSGLLGGTQPSTPREREALRVLTFSLYEDFLQRVREGRQLSAEQLEPLVGGRVWLGSEALSNGLVDQLGGIPEAIMKAQELAKLPIDRHHSPWMFYNGAGALSPLPFPTEPAEQQALLHSLLRPRAWAMLPFWWEEHYP